MRLVVFRYNQPNGLRSHQQERNLKKNRLITLITVALATITALVLFKYNQEHSNVRLEQVVQQNPITNIPVQNKRSTALVTIFEQILKHELKLIEMKEEFLYPEMKDRFSHLYHTLTNRDKMHRVRIIVQDAYILKNTNLIAVAKFGANYNGITISSPALLEKWISFQLCGNRGQIFETYLRIVIIHELEHLAEKFSRPSVSEEARAWHETYKYCIDPILSPYHKELAQIAGYWRLDHPTDLDGLRSVFAKFLDKNQIPLQTDDVVWYLIWVNGGRNPKSPTWLNIVKIAYM